MLHSSLVKYYFINLKLGLLRRSMFHKILMHFYRLKSFLQGYTRIIGHFVGIYLTKFFWSGYTNLNLNFVKKYQKHYFRQASQISCPYLLNYSFYSVWHSTASITFIFLQLHHCHFVAHSRVPTKSKAENLTFFRRK